MGLDVDNAAPTEAPTAPPAPMPEAPKPAPKLARPAVDGPARKARAERAAARRLVARLEDAASPDEVWARAAELRGGKLAPKDAPKGAEVAAVTEPGQLPGWPAPSLVAQYHPLALQAWASIEEQLRGSRYTISARTVEGQEVRPVEVLATGTAPCLAKWLPAVATTPEAALLVAVFAIFGPPAAAHLHELVGAWMARREEGATESAPEATA